MRKRRKQQKQKNDIQKRPHESSMTLKVFIADDSATIQKIVTLAFGCEDAVVRCVSDGSLAFDAIRDFQPDVVLADISMPGGSGYEICERLNEDTGLDSIPVILLTGTFEPFDEQEALRVGSKGHLTKPFDTSELIETVHALAAIRAKAQNRERSMEAPCMDMQKNSTTSPASFRAICRPISAQVLDSFLGSERILDMFDGETIQEAEAARSARDQSTSMPASARTAQPMRASANEDLSEDALNLIVERVMQRISADVIREVAWEVVPELSENIIRRTIEEQNKL
jgi:CheY-like chemotaxis protein